MWSVDAPLWRTFDALAQLSDPAPPLGPISAPPPATLVLAVEENAKCAEATQLASKNILEGKDAFEMLLERLRDNSFDEFRRKLRLHISVVMGWKLCQRHTPGKVCRWLFGDGTPNSGAVHLLLRILYENKQEFTLDATHNTVSFDWYDSQQEWSTRVVLAACNRLLNTYMIVVEPR